MSKLKENKKYVIDDTRLLSEWDTVKNSAIGLFPDKISHGSTKRAFWVCDKGHEFEARVDHRFIMGSNCPYCAGKLPIVGVNDFATLNPELLDEWDYDKNLKSPQEYLSYSNKKVWWRCANNHNWETSINHRVNGHGCPECAKKIRAASRINSLINKKGALNKNPELMREWDMEKNLPLTPNDVTAGSNKCVWWLCDICGSSYKKTIAAHSNGGGCPVCSGKQVRLGYNDLNSTFPAIAKEWHPSKNNNLLPDMVTAGSAKKVWWHCSSCGYDWQAFVYSRTGEKTGCPVCAGRVTIKGINDLVTTHPDIANEWHNEKNGDLTPNDVTYGSNRDVWWQCENGHSWRAKVASRVRGRGCPECAKKKRPLSRMSNLLEEKGSLIDNNPDLANEWHPFKNMGLLPSMVTSGSDKKVWWQCERGHSWSATISSRVRGNGCPVCSGEKSTSFPEQAIYYYLSKVTNAINRYKINGIEIDIFLPDLSVGIEYNGRYYHRLRGEHDVKKSKVLSDIGIRPIRIEEGNVNKVEGDILYYKYTDRYYYSLDYVIHGLCDILDLPKIDVNIMRDSKDIYEMYISLDKSNSFAAKYPELIKEWNIDKNGILTPWQISYGSSKKVWWKCQKCNYEWEAVVSSRKKSGCPCCANRVIVEGINDLAWHNPKLAAQWDYEKNEVLPTQVAANSHRHVWWKCSLGHSWKAEIKSRNQGCGCPICYNWK